MEEAAKIEFQQQVKGAYSTVDHAWLQYWYVSTYLLMCSSAVATGEEDSYARSSVEVCYYWCNEGGWRTRHAREIQCHMLSDRSDCKLWGEWKRLLLQHSDWETLSSFRYSMYDILCTTYYRYLFI